MRASALLARFAPLTLAATLLTVTGCSGASNTGLDDPQGSRAGGSGTSGGTTSAGGTTTGGGTGGSDDAKQASDPALPTPSDDTTDGPVRIKNVSFAASSASYSTWSAIDITFAIEKKTSAAIERVQEVSVTLGGQKRTFGLGSTCNGTWFELRASKVITLHLEDNGQNAKADFDCSGITYSESTKPWGDSVTVELRGLLDDATPWKASATGTR